jgi:hypothetical protein
MMGDMEVLWDTQNHGHHHLSQQHSLLQKQLCSLDGDVTAWAGQPCGVPRPYCCKATGI